jgi:hypothetical protein
MSYHLKVIKDFPIGFWKLDETSGLTAFDSSGCANNGTYYGGLDSSILPIVPGGLSGNLINSTKYIALPTVKDYYASVSGGGLGDEDTSDNDFTLELWIWPNITTSSRTILFADDASEIGIYYENGNVLFKVQGNEISYTLSNTGKAMHLVAVYSVTAIRLFVDGQEVAYSNLNSFKFDNVALSLAIGPTENSADYFIVDAPAVYRYALSPSKIYSHYVDGIVIVNPLQVVNSKGGYYFPTNEENMLKEFTYEFLPEKMKSFVDEDIYYDSNDGFISFYKTDTAQAKESVFYDILNVPSNLNIISSKIEWAADKRIAVEVSNDGITYEPCTNGSFMPFYNKSVTVNPGPLYIKITMSTEDASKYLPRFSKFKIKFYSDKDQYAQNYGYKITSNEEYSISSFNHPPLLRIKNDGITTSANNGFKINASDIRTIEFFFRPSALTSTTLLNATGLNLSWNGSGTISMTGISDFYVNGVAKTSSSSISSVFAPGMLYLVTIVTTTAVSGDIKFNYTNAGSGGPSNMYNNIGLYKLNMAQSDVTENFNSYVSRPAVTVVSSDIGLTDSGSEYYDDEYIVIRSV